jgi:hypothetical protein
LLFGVILLDTINLSKTINKATLRDHIAINTLQILFPTLDKDHLFRELNDAKTDQSFWRSLSIKQCLLFDYKLFTVTNSHHVQHRIYKLGMSSVMLPLEEMFKKNDFVYRDIRDYQQMHALDVLVLMSIYTDAISQQLVRQLAILSSQPELAQGVANYLQTYDLTSTSSALQLNVLQYERLQLEDQQQGTTLKLSTVLCNQGNIAMSRKQVAPLVSQYLEQVHLNI